VVPLPWTGAMSLQVCKKKETKTRRRKRTNIQRKREREKEAERKGRNKKTNKEKLTLREKVNRAAIACSTGIAIFPTFPFLSFPFPFLSCSVLPFIPPLPQYQDDVARSNISVLELLLLYTHTHTHRERERERVMSKLCPGSSLKIGKTGSRPKQN
jgi:hypothetical protein